VLIHQLIQRQEQQMELILYFDNVTTLGGGFGADNDITPYMNGNDGGSGGGGTYRSGAETGGSGKQTGAYGFDQKCKW